MKFNNLSAVILLSTLTISAFAQRSPEQDKLIDKIRAELGLPEFRSGIKIVPRSQLGMPDEVLKEGQAEARQRKKIGYAEKNMPYVSELLEMKTTAPIHIKQYATNLNDQGTYLRKSINDLKLAFKFKEITNDRLSPYGLHITMLGAAPQGGFHEESGGWSGAVQFFIIKNIGTCVYGMRNVKISGTAAMLAKEDVVYDINDKVTLVKVDGSKSSGFLYQVEWFDKNNFHELECANTQYSKHIKNEVINLARTIDVI